MMTDALAQSLLDHITRAIAEKGYAVVTVEADRASNAPGFSYTVGLAAKNLPELILFGLAAAPARTILTHAADLMQTQGALPDRHRTDGLIGDVLVEFRRVTESARATHLRLASAFHEHTDYEALQLVWSDRDGRFPDDPRFSATLRPLQPRLWVNEVLH